MFIASVHLSCDKSDAPSGNEGGAISFASSLTQTKALITDASAMTEFMVRGYYTFDGTDVSAVWDKDGDGVEEGIAVTQKQIIVNDVLTLVWAAPSEMTRYWLPNAKYSFAAFYPTEALVDVTDYALDAGGNFSDFKFTFTHTDAEQDFMTAQASTTSKKMEEDDFPALSLSFNHMLSNIRVSLKAEETSYTIRVLAYSLSGMSSDATYSDGDWATVTGHTSIDKIFDEPIELNTGTFSELMGSGGVNCIPETLAAGDVILRLYCSVLVGDTQTTKVYELELPAIEWEKSKRYTYTKTLGVDYYISFSDPTVEEWNGGRASGTIIIR